MFIVGQFAWCLALNETPGKRNMDELRKEKRDHAL